MFNIRLHKSSRTLRSKLPLRTKIIIYQSFTPIRGCAKLSRLKTIRGLSQITASPWYVFNYTLYKDLYI